MSFCFVILLRLGQLLINNHVIWIMQFYYGIFDVPIIYYYYKNLLLKSIANQLLLK